MTAATAWVISLSIVLADEIPTEFFCKEKNRYLSDFNFLEEAFSYERSKYGTPDVVEKLGEEGFLISNPDCCVVERENNYINENLNWVDRLFISPTVLVSINWSEAPNQNPFKNTNYLMSVCGEVQERHNFD